ncbi:type VI secretion IcmF C-terminal domain-containing protein [Citrobacter freundii]|nr:type VI secretion IcmF C-terminal domain-containing protein [Citrobacter freundii]MDT7425896.1 type VI secretion IcmF C-terminal domain-containing protein [Citrobacter freundii]
MEMGGKNRTASPHLNPSDGSVNSEQRELPDRLFRDACACNFFALSELLHRLASGCDETPELSLDTDPAQESIRFRADASLGFPVSDISALEQDTSGLFRMSTTFMGLQGSQSPLPGYYLDHLAWKSALKAVQLRLDQNSSDPIFTTRQMAKTLPGPLNRWVGKLADQAWHVVMVEAVHYMEVDWRNNVVKPFNEQLANNYPFNPRASQDASLDAFERFFKPDGVLDTFYQQNLKLFMENDLSLEDGDNSVIIREDIRDQLDTAQEIREAFFSRQNGLGAQFAVETVSLSGNKRRSMLNLDGQLVDYSQGRSYTAHLVWPNNMREGNESKLTLIGTSGSAPRSISFSGPWAQFRLFGAGQLTGVQDGTFCVRFNVDGGAMVYRVHTDTEDNPFTGGLFSQFRLPDTLY